MCTIELHMIWSYLFIVILDSNEFYEIQIFQGKGQGTFIAYVNAWCYGQM